MKMTTNKISHIETTLLGVFKNTFTAKNGNDVTIISLKTSDGYFTNYESVWKKQNIDVSALPDKTKVSVGFIEHECTEKDRIYKNFLSVKVLADVAEQSLPF